MQSGREDREPPSGKNSANFPKMYNIPVKSINNQSKTAGPLQ